MSKAQERMDALRQNQAVRDTIKLWLEERLDERKRNLVRVNEDQFRQVQGRAVELESLINYLK